MIYRLALGGVLGSLVSACSAASGVGTFVTSPAQAEPDEVAFGVGDSYSVGGKTTAISSRAVVVAAATDPGGPSDSNEGDSLWRVRGGSLEFCEWSADGSDDCRLATYENFAPPPLLTFLPTLIEPGNLGAGQQLAVFGDSPAIIGAVASNRTRSVRFVEDHAVWITAGATALIGAQPAFLCVVNQRVPVCRALPFTVQRVLGDFVTQHGATRRAVLWIHAAINVSRVGGPIAADFGLFRCEDRIGKPVCTPVKEN